MQLENYYEILEIPRNASLEQINDQYVILIATHLTFLCP